jgi:hypothetical protein
MQQKATSKENFDNNIYKRLIRVWLVTILLILPFQLEIAVFVSQWNIKLSNIINNLDELTIVVFLLLAIGEFYKLKKLPNKLFFFCLSF